MKADKLVGSCTRYVFVLLIVKYQYVRVTISHSIPNLFFALQGGGWVAGASNARLYFEDDHDQKRIGGWCAASRDPQWLKVDLGKVKQITGIATQGDTVREDGRKEGGREEGREGGKEGG